MCGRRDRYTGGGGGVPRGSTYQSTVASARTEPTHAAGSEARGTGGSARLCSAPIQSTRTLRMCRVPIVRRGVACRVMCSAIGFASLLLSSLRFGLDLEGVSCSTSSRSQTQPVREARVRVTIARQLTLAGNTASPVRCRTQRQRSLRRSSELAFPALPPDEAACRALLGAVTRVRSAPAARRAASSRSTLCAARPPRPLARHCAPRDNGSGRHTSARLTPPIGRRALCALLIWSAHTAQRQLVRGLQLGPLLPTAQVTVCEVLTDTGGVEFARIRSSLCTSVRNVCDPNPTGGRCFN